MLRAVPFVFMMLSSVNASSHNLTLWDEIFHDFEELQSNITSTDERIRSEVIRSLKEDGSLKELGYDDFPEASVSKHISKLQAEHRWQNEFWLDALDETRLMIDAKFYGASLPETPIVDELKSLPADTTEADLRNFLQKRKPDSPQQPLPLRESDPVIPAAQWKQLHDRCKKNCVKLEEGLSEVTQWSQQLENLKQGAPVQWELLGCANPADVAAAPSPKPKDHATGPKEESQSEDSNRPTPCQKLMSLFC